MAPGVQKEGIFPSPPPPSSCGTPSLVTSCCLISHLDLDKPTLTSLSQILPLPPDSSNSTLDIPMSKSLLIRNVQNRNSILNHANPLLCSHPFPGQMALCQVARNEIGTIFDSISKSCRIYKVYPGSGHFLYPPPPLSRSKPPSPLTGHLSSCLCPTMVYSSYGH